MGQQAAQATTANATKSEIAEMDAILAELQRSSDNYSKVYAEIDRRLAKADRIGSSAQEII
jgi:hypothetical protein